MTDNKQPQNYLKIRGESGSEHSEQKAFFALVTDIVKRRIYDHLFNQAGKLRLEQYDCERLIYAVPNGASVGGDRVGRQIQGAKLKAEGLRRGIPDINVDIPAGGFSGLRIEMKRRDGTGRLSDDQDAVHAALRGAGFKVVVCKTFAEAGSALVAYLNGEVF